MSNPGPELRVERLLIHRFRAVRPGSVLEFADGVNVILGENASGKSTLLALLVALVRGDAQAFARHDVDAELTLRLADLRIVYRLTVAEGGWSAMVHLRRDEAAVEYSWGSAQGLRLAGDTEDRLPPSAGLPAAPLWFHPIPCAELPGETLAQGTRIAALVARWGLFDEHLGVWRSMREQGASARHPSQRADLPAGWPTGDPDEDWSLGQKRVHALMWLLGATPGVPLVADELAAGLHHSWVQAALDLADDRQVIVAAQNPLLLDLLNFDEAEDVCRAVTICRRLPDASGGMEWAWQKPSVPRAQRIYSSWVQGMSFVSEVLQREGLW